MGPSTIYIDFAYYIINKIKIIIYFSGFIDICRYITFNQSYIYELTNIDESTEIYDYLKVVNYKYYKVDNHCAIGVYLP